jgi:hypothetical protein
MYVCIYNIYIYTYIYIYIHTYIYVRMCVYTQATYLVHKHRQHLHSRLMRQPPSMHAIYAGATHIINTHTHTHTHYLQQVCEGASIHVLHNNPQAALKHEAAHMCICVYEYMYVYVV